MMASLKGLFLILSLLFLFSCGGGKSGSGVSTMNSSLTFPYKYFVYVANYTDNTLSSFSMSRDTGTLTPIETTSAGIGGNPIALAVSPNGDKLYVAKAGVTGTNSNLQVFSISKSNGALTPFQSIQVNNSSQSLSSVSVSLDGRFVYLGSYGGDATVYSVSYLTGNLMLFKNYSISASTKSYIHPNGESLLWASNTSITYWPLNKTSGEIVFPGPANTTTLNSTQLNSIAISPDGRIYASYFIQGYGLINSYNFDSTNKSASSIGSTSVGSSSGGIAISNFGKVLIATEPNANKLHSYLINSSTGALTEVDSKLTENYPQQAVFFPDGQYALVINKASKSVSTFLVEESTGILKSLSSIGVGTDPQDILVVKISN